MMGVVREFTGNYKIIITHKIPIMGRLSKDFKNRDGLDNLLINILN